MTLRRREILASGPALILLTSAGCVGDIIGSDQPATDDLGSGREKIVDSEEEVPTDGTVSFSFVLGREATLEYEFTVTAGPDVEIFVLDEDGFEEYQSGNEFEALGHETGAESSDSVSLEEGSYRLVIDNSDTGDLEPPDTGAESAAVEVQSWIVR